MALFGLGGGGEQATAHIDDEITVEEGGVSQTMTIEMDLVGDNEDVQERVTAYKNGGGNPEMAEGDPKACVDCDDENRQAPRI